MAPTPGTPTSRLDGGLIAALCLWAVGVHANEAVASVGLALTVALSVARARPWREPPRLWLRAWAPLWLFAVWALLAPLVGGRTPTGTGVARLADWLALPAAAYASARLSRGAFARVAAVSAAVFLVSCVAAGLQSYGVWPTPSGGAVDWLHLPMQRVYEEAPGGRFMGGGLLFHRLKFAHVGGLMVIAASAFALRGEGSLRNGARVVAVLGGLSVAAFPFARGALVALALALTVLGLASSRRRARAGFAAAALLLAVAGAVWATPAWRERLRGSLGAEGNGNRATLWAAGVRGVASHPVLGLGLGRFHPAAFTLPGEVSHDASHVVKAHNQLLTVAAETGIPGAALFVWLLVWLGMRVDPRRAEGAAALGGLIFFALLSVAHDPLFHAPFSMALVLVLGIGAGRGERVRAQPAQAVR